VTRERIDIVLVGGARDGDEMTIQATEWLVIPRLPDVDVHARSMRVTEDEPLGVHGSPEFERDIYRRDVISDRTHRWRYVLERRGRPRLD
jgi:hypothetical protein